MSETGSWARHAKAELADPFRAAHPVCCPDLPADATMTALQQAGLAKCQRLVIGAYIQKLSKLIQVDQEDLSPADASITVL